MEVNGMDGTGFVSAIIITTLLVLILIGGIAVSFFLAARQRSQQQMALAQARLSYERELRQVEAEVSEYLMQQFAQELHDNIGHLLTCIRLEVENKKLDNPGMESVFAPTEKYLDEAGQQLRLLSRTLNTDYIATNGLAQAIQVEVERQRQLKKFDIHFHHGPDNEVPTLSKNQELMVFRIFQEIVQNAIRHSKAKNLYVSLDYAPHFELAVRDDGSGFVWAEMIKSPKASGLRNIVKRAAMAHIDCQATSLIGQGCEYRLTRNENEKLRTT